jgi:hypothetical protein
LESLNEQGWATETAWAFSWMASDEKFEELAGKIEASDVIVLAVPLYVDSAPAEVIRMMEMIRDRGIRDAGKKKFVVFVNSGFPQSSHNDIAILIYQRFAEEVGFQWYGGLPVGGGEVIGGRPLAKVGWPTKYLMEALKETAECLVSGSDFPKEAVDLAAKKTLPYSIYTWIANFEWKRRARKQKLDLYAKPFEEPPGER